MIPPSPDASTAEAPIVRVIDLHKQFGSLEVLKGINLEIMRQEVVSLIGSSGSGKSTLLRCLNFLEEPTGGRIYIEDQLLGYREAPDGSIKRSPRREVYALRQKVGMVFQLFNLWPHRTALENVIEAPRMVKGLNRQEATEIGEALLNKVGLSDKLHEFPERLSGGQQQRVAIARALAMSPKLMLFDEPTSALDPELTGEVLDAMKILASEGMTMIIVTHLMEFAREVSDRVLFMDDGIILEEGPADQVILNPAHERTQRFLSRILS